MTWDVELANEFKKRNNVKSIGVQLGQVISSAPITISIMNNRVILDSSNYYLCSKLSVVAGDKVLCIPSCDGQKYFIVDKVV